MYKSNELRLFHFVEWHNEKLIVLVYELSVKSTFTMKLMDNIFQRFLTKDKFFLLRLALGSI